MCVGKGAASDVLGFCPSCEREEEQEVRRETLPGGDAVCRTGIGILGRRGHTGQSGSLGPLSHFLCDNLHPHPVLSRVALTKIRVRTERVQANQIHSFPSKS